MSISNNIFTVNGEINPVPLAQKGPTLPIEIHIDPALANNYVKNEKPIPTPISGKALFDTGASISAVDIKVIEQLKLNPISMATVHTPSNTVQQGLYRVSFVFPTIKDTIKELTVNFGAVLGSNLQSQGIIALIGRDFLLNCILIYNGPIGIFSISI